MKKNKFIFSKTNYTILIIGIIFIITGFIAIYLEKAKHGLGFLGLTLGPILLSTGYIIQFIAILYKKNNKK